MRFVRVYDEETEVVRTELQGLDIPRLSYHRDRWGYTGNHDAYIIGVDEEFVETPFGREFWMAELRKYMIGQVYPLSAVDMYYNNNNRGPRDLWQYEGRWFETRAAAGKYAATVWFLNNQPHLRAEVVEDEEGQWTVMDTLADLPIGQVLRWDAPGDRVGYSTVPNEDRQPNNRAARLRPLSIGRTTIGSLHTSMKAATSTLYPLLTQPPRL